MNVDRRDAERGLYQKFVVYRVDGRDRPGEKHEFCPYFVLDLHHDPHAISALQAYAESCRKDFPVLATDLDLIVTGLTTVTGVAQEKPYAVWCYGGAIEGVPACGKVYLTKEQYDQQMSRPDRLWMCPYCHSEASWDDENYETWHSNLPKRKGGIA